MIENIVVINEEGKTFDVPIFYGSLEKMFIESKDKDGNDKLQLPLIAVDMGKGILFAWTLYKEDMNQIIEQLFTILTDKITSVANNFDSPPEHGRLNVYKFQINFLA